MIKPPADQQNCNMASDLLKMPTQQIHSIYHSDTPSQLSLEHTQYNMYGSQFMVLQDNSRAIGLYIMIIIVAALFQ